MSNQAHASRCATSFAAKLWSSAYAEPLDPARDYPKPVRDCGLQR